MKKMLFVFNPHSGKAQIRNVLLEILQIFTEGGFEVTVYPTRKAGDGKDYVLEREGQFDVIACSGGDGTLNEIVAAVNQFQGEKPPIGYIPSGTTNDFAASLLIPKEMTEAAKLIVQEKRFPCDIGRFNQTRTFNYVAAFGAFTKVAYSTPQELKNMLGHQAYLLEAAKSLMELKAYPMRITSQTVELEGNYLFGMVSNAHFVGGMKMDGLSADMSDGMFEVLLVKEIHNPVEFQQVVSAFLSQDYSSCPVIDHFKTTRIVFEMEESMNWTLDGEYGGHHKRAEIEVCKNAVQFLVG